MSYRYSSISKTGNGKKRNEDSIGIMELEDGVLCIVCDGLSGEFAAERAAKLCVESIQNYFQTSSERNHLVKIRDSIKIANRYILELAASKKEWKGMATTTDVFFLNNNIIYWGHIGDSRIYDLKNGKLNQLTKDHSLVQQMVDGGFLSIKDAFKHPNKNVIMKALGEQQKIEIDLSKVILKPSDRHRFMMCSDGVNAVIDNMEMEEILKISDLDKCIDVFDEKIQSRGAPDDYSLIILEQVN